MATRARIMGLFAGLALALGSTPTVAQAEAPLEVAEKLADWQLARLHEMTGVSRNAKESADGKSWIRAAFWIGLSVLADHDRQPRFREAILAMGRANG